VVGIHDTPRGCLKIVMGHADSVTQADAANDNASGVGVIVALAGRLDAISPRCDLWLVAVGSEEREVTGLADHRGATALVKRVERHKRSRDLRYAFSADMVGRGKRFWLRSPRSGPRKGIERQVLKLARRSNVPVKWERDSGTGNSDHREFELAGLPGMALQVWNGYDPCHHEPCDRAGRLRKVSLRLALRLATAVARTP
jgi:Zn-dependent M28 family amino/carboxypeptidase